MSREIRRVPPDWKHPPRNADDVRNVKYAPMFDAPRNYARELAEWKQGKAKWDAGERPSYADPEDRETSWEDWSGPEPDPRRYMPDWPEAERTHFQMYETTTEGTPKSPVFESAEACARWCFENKVSIFGTSPGSLERWLEIAEVGSTIGSFARKSTGEFVEAPVPSDFK